MIQTLWFLYSFVPSCQFYSFFFFSFFFFFFFLSKKFPNIKPEWGEVDTPQYSSSIIMTCDESDLAKLKNQSIKRLVLFQTYDKKDKKRQDILSHISRSRVRPLPGFAGTPCSRISMTRPAFQTHVRNKTVYKNIVVSKM